jgi:hypothetical protein
LVIDASRPKDDVGEAVWEAVERLLEAKKLDN